MRVKAILFDLHHTTTQHTRTSYSLVREVCAKYGFDLENFSDEELDFAFKKTEWTSAKGS